MEVMEHWRCDTGMETWKQKYDLWSSGGGIAGVQSREYGGTEVRSRAAGVAAWRHGSMERWRCAAGVGTWRYGAPEERFRCSDVEAWRYGALDARYSCGEWRDSGIELWEARCRAVT